MKIDSKFLAFEMVASGVLFATGLGLGYTVGATTTEPTIGVPSLEQKTAAIDLPEGFLDFLQVPTPANPSDEQLKEIEKYNEKLMNDMKELEQMIEDIEREVDYKSKVIKV